jgi:ATP-binding cassette subfamily B protein
MVNGEDIRNIRLIDLRKNISFMPQEPFLFDGTIRENLTLGTDDVKESDLEEVMEKASLLETVKSFPAGIDTIVGEKGIVLSGGQKQRIALARALLSDSPILLLDDPVSQVDVETGLAIINNIKSMQGEKTIIIVSHRLSALCFADHIIVIDKGEIAESGDHKHLMELGRYYADTYRMQEIEEELNAL